MSKIIVNTPKEEELKDIGIDKWSPWSCEPSVFDWTYNANETAYLFKGKVKVITPKEEVEIKAGDLVFFPNGLSCTWEVLERVEKVYKFS